MGIHCAYTSLLDQREKDVEKIEESARRFVEGIERFNRRHGDLTALLAEMMILAERFDLDTPDLTRPRAPASEECVASALSKVEGVFSGGDDAALPRTLRPGLPLPHAMAGAD